ncbi:hypothetical protein L228DRAFT_280116 [Xylona heveae TC161]|uniref:Uncharacterized protein n=1 Tax=Xylona heveae (strain CBS 132557 / TC161) TaxID=1328760 RepID=A0A165K4Q3_XYLHT|nr:hypothetical protein L228DRAFT_280116 [Xylona heveae TC161]KZF26979.1 hypothetical protein L228DRAFT_280116 [Xylona heveae TC161]
MASSSRDRPVRIVDEDGYKFYAIPRTHFSKPEHSTYGQQIIPKYRCEELLRDAPLPTHNRTNGKRPHAHYDSELLFANERAQLGIFPGVHVPNRYKDQGPPRLWAYPAQEFDYEHQDKFGHDHHRTPGPHRIITDKDKNIQGLVTHPVGDPIGFVRVHESVRRVPTPPPPPPLPSSRRYYNPEPRTIESVRYRPRSPPSRLYSYRYQ